MDEAGKPVDPILEAAILVAQARLLVQQGEPDTALPLFERAQALAKADNDPRTQAVVMGGIARLKADKGEVDAALALHQEALGDADGIATASWDLGQLHLGQGKVEEAVPLVLEAYAIFQRTGRLDGLAVVGTVAGQILVAAGAREEGLEVLRRSAAGFRKLGRPADTEGVEELIRAIEGGA